jgi:hypothetical protein
LQQILRIIDKGLERARFFGVLGVSDLRDLKGKGLAGERGGGGKTLEEG